MKGIVVSNFRGKVKKHEMIKVIKENKLTVLLLVFLFAGMIFGAISARFAGDEILENLDFLFASNFRVRASQPAFATFAASLTSSFIFVFCLFLLGLSAWGILIIPLIPFFRGLGLGLTAGFLYSTYGLKGVAFHLIVLLPGVFLSAAAIILQSKESLVFSARLASKILPKGVLDRLWPSFQLYLLRTGYIFIILVFSAAIDLFFTAVFAGYFTF